MPALYDEDGRDGALAQLLLHEVRQAQTMPLFAPIPRQLARLCKAFLKSPSIQATPQAWAQRLHKSLRTFTRFSPADGYEFWGMAAASLLLAALPRLSAGQSVTQVALDLGYDSPSAFPRCSSDGSARRQWSSSANPTRPHPGSSVSQS